MLGHRDKKKKKKYKFDFTSRKALLRQDILCGYCNFDKSNIGYSLKVSYRVKI